MTPDIVAAVLQRIGQVVRTASVYGAEKGRGEASEEIVNLLMSNIGELGQLMLGRPLSEQDWDHVWYMGNG